MRSEVFLEAIAVCFLSRQSEKQAGDVQECKAIVVGVEKHEGAAVVVVESRETEGAKHTTLGRRARVYHVENRAVVLVLSWGSL